MSLDIEQAAESLWREMQNRRHMPAEWQKRLTMDQAYRVQLAILRRYIEGGDRQAGWKIGLTAAAMRAQQNVFEPCFGFLLESGHRESGHVFNYGELIDPGFENELCLTIGHDLEGPNVTIEEVTAAVTHAAPALEIVERRGNFALDLPLSMADNAQQKAFVTGPAVALNDSNRDLASASVSVDINGSLRELAPGAAVMEKGALYSIQWLANKLSEFDLSLKAGMRVMSGSFTKQYPIEKGDRIASAFIPFGTVKATFL